MNYLYTRHLAPEIVGSYHIWTRGFELQVPNEIEAAIRKGLEEAGLDPDDFVILRRENVKWTTKSELISNHLKKYTNQLTKKKEKLKHSEVEHEHLEAVIRDFNKMKGVEYDSFFICFDKKDPEKSHSLTISLERKINLVTPFCFLSEVTLRGTRDGLRAKIQQITLQMIFLTEFYEKLSFHFKPYFRKIKSLFKKSL